MSNIKLTDNQRAVLSAAARSANLVAWPLPKRLKLSPGSAAIVIRGLLQKGLLEKRPAIGTDAVWKEKKGSCFTLVITKTGLVACGIQPADDSPPKASVAAKRVIVAAVSQDERRMPRAGSKLAMLVGLLGRDEGATIEELVEATGWQAHSVRGVLSGALQKRFGFEIRSERVEGGERVYKVSPC